MNINVTLYQEHYHDKKNRLKDNWQEGIRLLPFTSNTSSAVDRGCSLSGPTGAFFRAMDNDNVRAIDNFKDAEDAVKDYLINQKKMDPNQADEFILMFRDIMQINGSLNITDIAFLKYLPLVPEDDSIPLKTRDKYRAGITKLSQLLTSMVASDFSIPAKDNNNLFTRLLKESLQGNGIGTSPNNNAEERYHILPFIKESFKKDLEWILNEESAVIVRYIHLLLHFYVCYSLLQVIPRLSHKQRVIEKPVNYYFILKSERASVNHEAVQSWKQILPKNILDKIFGRSQALDIINCVLGGNIGFYPDVLNALKQTPFNENKEVCEELLRLYQAEKIEVFTTRNTESGSIDVIETTADSYEEFLHKLEYLCTGLQSPSYASRMRKKVIDILSMRLLQIRRGNYVLVLDNEMLVFLAAMITGSQRTKLEDMYKGFNSYGIFFTRATRTAIENYLLKLNLLDRKSDSGEAQYVKIIL